MEECKGLFYKYDTEVCLNEAGKLEIGKDTLTFTEDCCSGCDECKELLELFNKMVEEGHWPSRLGKRKGMNAGSIYELIPHTFIDQDGDEYKGVGLIINKIKLGIDLYVG